MAALIEVNLKASLNNSSFIRWAAWRQLASRRSRHKGLSFMTVFSILGVTFGVAALVIVLSVMGGFEEILKDKMLRGQAHVEILAKNSILALGKPGLNRKQNFFRTKISRYAKKNYILNV